MNRQDYYNKNKEKIKEQARKWYLNNRDKSIKRALQYNKDNKESHSLAGIRYNRKNREATLIRSYKTTDKKKGLECTLTVEWMKENITSKECEYCGDIYNLGCDRIDNNLGHTMENCVPCCKECNIARGDNFSYKEMKFIIGPAIKLVKQQRNLNNESIL